MTFKEKLQKEHPEMLDDRFGGGCMGCPSNRGYEAGGCGLCSERKERRSNKLCTECWNREIPGTNLRGLRAKIHLIDELHGVPNLTANAKSKINEKIYLDPNDVLERLMSKPTFDYIKDDLGNAYDLQRVIYKMSLNSIYGAPKVYIPEIKKVIFNDPATIVIWADGEKTVVKCQNGEPYDAEKGLAMAIAKRALGNKGNYFDEIKKWTKEYKKPAKCEPKKPVWEYEYEPVSNWYILECPICETRIAISATRPLVDAPRKCHHCHIELEHPNIKGHRNDT